jgi:hypothetical protein
MNEQNEQIEPKTDTETDNSRRDFLKKAGKLAVYTPPIMLAMSSPSFATGWGKSGGHEYPKHKKKHSKKRHFPFFKHVR